MSVNNAALTLIKYGDNIALTGRLKGEITLFQRYQRIEQLSYRFGKSFLELSVGKTKGLVCSNRRGGGGKYNQRNLYQFTEG